MRDRGVILHLASGGRTDDLEPYLRRMGAWELIGRPYGVDLLGVSKTGPRCYERIVAGVGSLDGLLPLLLESWS